MAKEIIVNKAGLRLGLQIKKALDGRSQRWLSIQVGIPEAELSKKLNGTMLFTGDEVERIEKKLKVTLNKNIYGK